jgi:hypothetical protein
VVVSFLNVPFLLSASFCPGSVRHVCGWASGPHRVDSSSSLLESKLVRGLRREPTRRSIAVPGNCQEILARVLAKPGLASAKALIVGRSWEIKRFEGYKPIQRERRTVVDCIQSACCVNKRRPPHPAPLIARRTDAKVPEDRKIDGRDVLDLLLGDPDAESPHDVHYYDVDAVVAARGNSSAKERPLSCTTPSSLRIFTVNCLRGLAIARYNISGSPACSGDGSTTQNPTTPREPFFHRICLLVSSAKRNRAFRFVTHRTTSQPHHQLSRVMSVFE